MFRQHPVGRGAVEIVSVNDRKGPAHRRFRRQDRLAGAPRFRPIRWWDVRWRHVGQLLKHINHLHPRLQPASHRRAEIPLDVTANHEYHPVETGAAGVMGRVFDDELAAGADGLDLLQAAKTVAHARGENHKIVGHGRQNSEFGSREPADFHARRKSGRWPGRPCPNNGVDAGPSTG